MTVSRPAFVYREVRRPAPALLRAVAAGAALVTLAVLVFAELGPVSVTLLLGALAAFLWWCWSTRYEVRVSTERLEVCFAPFRARQVPLQEVVSCAQHMAFPWGDGSDGHRQVEGVDTWQAGTGAGLLVELDGGEALWVDCGRPDRLAVALKTRRRRRQRGA